MNMIPGMGKMTKDLDIDNSAFNKVESMILSMTPQERENPDLLNMSRKKRIAQGSGHNMEDINAFIKQFEQMRKMMHKMSKMPGVGGPAPGKGAAGRKKRKSRKRRR